MSGDARGSIKKAITFSYWRGVQVVRGWFKPAIVTTAKAINQKTAMSLTIAWVNQASEAVKAAYNVGAEGKPYSGTNLFVRRMLDAYTTQLGQDVTPASVSVAGLYPNDVTTWVAEV